MHMLFFNSFKLIFYFNTPENGKNQTFSDVFGGRSNEILG